MTWSGTLGSPTAPMRHGVDPAHGLDPVRRASSGRGGGSGPSPRRARSTPDRRRAHRRPCGPPRPPRGRRRHRRSAQPGTARQQPRDAVSTRGHALRQARPGARPDAPPCRRASPPGTPRAPRPSRRRRASGSRHEPVGSATPKRFESVAPSAITFMSPKPGSARIRRSSSAESVAVGPDAGRVAVVVLRDRRAERLDALRHAAGEAVDGRAFAKERRRARPGPSPRSGRRRGGRAAAAASAGREGRRHGHLLVEREADQERERVACEQRVGLVVAREVEAVGHRRDRIACGRAVRHALSRTAT